MHPTSEKPCTYLKFFFRESFRLEVQLGEHTDVCWQELEAQKAVTEAELKVSWEWLVFIDDINRHTAVKHSAQ